MEPSRERKLLLFHFEHVVANSEQPECMPLQGFTVACKMPRFVIVKFPKVPTCNFDQMPVYRIVDGEKSTPA